MFHGFLKQLLDCNATVEILILAPQTILAVLPQINKEMKMKKVF